MNNLTDDSSSSEEIYQEDNSIYADITRRVDYSSDEDNKYPELQLNKLLVKQQYITSNQALERSIKRESIQNPDNSAKMLNEPVESNISRLFRFKSFEQYRNNTSFYDINKQWLNKVNDHYSKNKGRFVLQKHQFETVMYMGGQFMNGIHPRGLLLFHTMGTGKTITNIASGFYCLATLSNYTPKSKIIFICNKALSLQIQAEIVKYITMLNKYQINEQFQPQTKPLTAYEYIDKCIFITFNDSFSLDDNLMKGFDSIQDSFVVFDEVHNLFKSVLNDSDRGRQVYHYLLSKRLQIQFNSGTPFSSDLNEIGVCFNVLSGNSKLFPVQSVNSIFVQSSPESDDQLYIKNKEVLMRRLSGLVSAAEIETNNEHYPKMNELQIVQVEIAKEYRQVYIDTRKQNLKSQKFMSDSHLLDNAYIMSDDTIVSSKFDAIKAEIEKDAVPQLIYSQYVHRGSIIFTDYCLQQNKKSKQKYTWKLFTDASYKRSENEIIYAIIHGQVESIERMKIIGIFNSAENVNGNLITVLCLSKASVEGINIKYVRKVHIMEAQWESRDLQQVISRGQRMYSHSLLPIDQRNLTPYIYLTYTNDPKYAFNKDITNMSTDQQIFFKQQSLVSFQNTLFTLLHFVSFNCHNLNEFMYMDQLFKPEFHRACFTCESTNQQLFDPNFIHQDIVINNCKRPKCKDTSMTFEYKNVQYGMYVDIYAPFGFWVFEIRDRFKKPIEPEQKDFNQIMILAKTSITNKQQIIQQKSEIDETDDSYATMETQIQLITTMQLDQINKTNKLQVDHSRRILHLIQPSALTFTLGQLHQFLQTYRILKSVDIQVLQKSQNSETSNQRFTARYAFYDIFEIFSSQQSRSNLSKTTFIINQTIYNYTEFIQHIVHKLYQYLLIDIYMDRYQQIVVFFKKYKQIIVINEIDKQNTFEEELNMILMKRMFKTQSFNIQ